jgi:hypothetical protein
MDEAEVEPLIELLFDRSARLDERGDAGQYLGESDSPAAVAALRRMAASAEEDEAGRHKPVNRWDRSWLGTAAHCRRCLTHIRNYRLRRDSAG